MTFSLQYAAIQTSAWVYIQFFVTLTNSQWSITEITFG